MKRIIRTFSVDRARIASKLSQTRLNRRRAAMALFAVSILSFGGVPVAKAAPLNIDFNSNSAGPFSPTETGFYGVDVPTDTTNTINAAFAGIDTEVAPSEHEYRQRSGKCVEGHSE